MFMRQSPNMPYSLNILRDSGNVIKLATKHEPTELILDVAKYYDGCNGESLIDSIHLYPFGGFKTTLKWVNKHL